MWVCVHVPACVHSESEYLHKRASDFSGCQIWQRWLPRWVARWCPPSTWWELWVSDCQALSETALHSLKTREGWLCLQVHVEKDFRAFCSSTSRRHLPFVGSRDVEEWGQLVHMIWPLIPGKHTSWASWKGAFEGREGPSRLLRPSFLASLWMPSVPWGSATFTEMPACSISEKGITQQPRRQHLVLGV